MEPGLSTPVGAYHVADLRVGDAFRAVGIGVARRHPECPLDGEQRGEERAPKSCPRAAQNLSPRQSPRRDPPGDVIEPIVHLVSSVVTGPLGALVRNIIRRSQPDVYQRCQLFSYSAARYLIHGRWWYRGMRRTMTTHVWAIVILGGGGATGPTGDDLVSDNEA
jgi:hypothetical protein